MNAITPQSSQYDKETFIWLYRPMVDMGKKVGGYRLHGYKLRTLPQESPYMAGKKIAIFTSRYRGKIAYCVDESGNYWSTNLITAITETGKHGCFMEITK